MTTKNNRISKLAAAAAILLSMLVQASPVRGAAEAPVELAFTKWFRSGLPQGRLDNAVGTFAFLATAAPPEDQPPISPISQIDAEYRITFDGNSFTASLEGHQNNKTHKGVLNGIITEGWQLGAQAHVEWDVVDQGPLPAPRVVCPVRICNVGTIQIMGN